METLRGRLSRELTKAKQDYNKAAAERRHIWNNILPALRQKINAQAKNAQGALNANIFFNQAQRARKRFDALGKTIERFEKSIPKTEAALIRTTDLAQLLLELQKSEVSVYFKIIASSDTGEQRTIRPPEQPTS